MLRRTYGCARLTRSTAPNISNSLFAKPNFRQRVWEEGRKAEDTFYVDWVKLAKDEEAKLLASGSKITEVAADKRDKLNSALGEAEFEVAEKQDAKSIGELREFAKSKELY